MENKAPLPENEENEEKKNVSISQSDQAAKLDVSGYTGLDSGSQRADTNKKSGESDLSKYTLRMIIDKVNNRFPFCIVWTPLPMISWIFPFIGHTGICTYNIFLF